MFQKILKFIKIDLSFVIMLILSLFTFSFMTFFLSIIFILIHELFHLLTSLLFSVKPKSITITALGGIIDIPLYKLSPIKKIIVSSSGIISNMLIIIFIYQIKDKDTFLSDYYSFIIEYNYSLILFSILPIYPLDGYNILQGVLEKALNDDLSKGLSISRNISLISLTLMVIYSLYSKTIGLIIIMGYLIFKNFILFKRKDYVYLQRYQYYLVK